MFWPGKSQYFHIIVFLNFYFFTWEACWIWSNIFYLFFNNFFQIFSFFWPGKPVEEWREDSEGRWNGEPALNDNNDDADDDNDDDDDDDDVDDDNCDDEEKENE